MSRISIELAAVLLTGLLLAPLAPTDPFTATVAMVWTVFALAMLWRDHGAGTAGPPTSIERVPDLPEESR